MTLCALALYLKGLQMFRISSFILDLMGLGTEEQLFWIPSF